MQRRISSIIPANLQYHDPSEVQKKRVLLLSISKTVVLLYIFVGPVICIFKICDKIESSKEQHIFEIEIWL